MLFFDIFYYLIFFFVKLLSSFSLNPFIKNKTYKYKHKFSQVMFTRFHYFRFSLISKFLKRNAVAEGFFFFLIFPFTGPEPMIGRSGNGWMFDISGNGLRYRYSVQQLESSPSTLFSYQSTVCCRLPVQVRVGPHRYCKAMMPGNSQSPMDSTMMLNTWTTFRFLRKYQQKK